MSFLRPEAKDPRHIVTPDAFEVAPELLGRPLAQPWRRGVALLADLLLIFFLTQLGSVSASLAATAVFLILTLRLRIERWWLRWTYRVGVVAMSIPIFLIVLIVLSWSQPVPFTGMSPAQWIEFGNAVGSQDPAEQAEAVNQMVESMEEAGTDVEELQSMIDSFELPSGVEIDLKSMAESGGAEPENPAPDPAVLAPLLEDYAAALRGGEEAKIAELGLEAEELIAKPVAARLEQRIERLQTNSRELFSEVLELREKVENPSFMRTVSGMAADLGLTFGWSGVYFTFFLTWWRGRTPGKWLFAMRVVSLDHRPLGLWSSFERFAGYAAGLATGLFGFLQILWDPNRQGIQDKIVGTVVVLEPRGSGR